MIHLTLPIPPSINHYFARNGHRTYLPAKVKEYRQAVAEAVNETGVKTGGCLVAGRLAVFAAIYPATRRKQDIDNRAKGLLDALQHAGVFDDDEQIDSLHLVRGDIVKGGKVEVVITEIS